MKHVQGGPKSCTFLTTISLEPFKIKWCWFYWNFRKISVMKRNYKFLANLLQVFSVKYSRNYCIIVNVICKNMHHLTAGDKALILGSRVKKRWNVDKVIFEFPNKQWKRQTLYYLVRKTDQTESAASCLVVAGLTRSAKTRSTVPSTSGQSVLWWQGSYMEHKLK